MRISRLILFLFLLGSCWTSSGQETMRTDTISVKIYFRQGYSTLNPSFQDNGPRLDMLIRKITDFNQDPMCRIQSIRIVASSSPEGNSVLNKRLSEKRAIRISDFLRRSTDLPDSLIETDPRDIDWLELTGLVETSNMPYRDEVLDILHYTPEWIIRNGKVVDGRKRQLWMLHGGDCWRYMEEYFFPELRGADVRVVCQVVRQSESVVLPAERDTVASTSRDPIVAVRRDTTVSRDTVRTSDVADPLCKPFYMALKTNLLYDMALVPNIGAEFFLGRGWSICGNWMYAWWKSDRRHRYWRTYGGELDIRKYFGRRASEKPLTGHHLGGYGQIFTYDFETGGRGYMGGKPGGTLWDKMNYAVGLEYGYSLPVGRRLNLDFTVGVGYWGGEYQKYLPEDGHYVWTETRQRHWFGPTKAEISLVWLLGRGNYNAKKGGKR